MSCLCRWHGYVRSGIHSGNISAKSRTVADLVIISPTQTDIILREVADAKGVRSHKCITQECNETIG